MQDSPFSMSWHHATAAPPDRQTFLPAAQNGIYRKNDTQLRVSIWLFMGARSVFSAEGGRTTDRHVCWEVNFH
jgi:hypothetical protein